MVLLTLSVVFWLLRAGYSGRTDGDCSESCEQLRTEGLAAAQTFLLDEEEAVVQLRCKAACQDELSLLPDNEVDRVGMVDSCVKGCVQSFMDDSLTLTQCRTTCNNVDDSTSCVTGCMIYENYIRVLKERVPLTDPDCSEAGGLSVNEIAYVSDGDRCFVYECQNMSQVVRGTMNCTSSTVRSCTLSVGSIRRQLARCCGYCTAPSTPELPPAVHPVQSDDNDLLYGIESDTQTGDNNVLFLIRLDSNQTTIYLTAPALPAKLSMKSFACSTVELSYAVVNSYGTSSFSPKTQINVVPSAARDIADTFEEDLSFLQHATLKLTWERPTSNFAALCSYELVVSVIEDNSTSELCLLQETYTAVIDKNATSHTFAGNSSNVNSAPLFDCRYRVKLISLPGEASTTRDIQIIYDSKRPRLNISCTATFNSTRANYDIEATWSVDALAVPVIKSFDLEFRQVLLQGGIVVRPDDVQTPTVNTRANVTDYGVIISEQRVIPEEQLSVYSFIVKININEDTPFFWRRPLVPRDNRNRPEDCYISAPPIPPATITTITAENLTFFEALNRLEVLVEWEAPEFANGVLQYYQLRLGTENIAPNADQERGTQVFRANTIQPMEMMFNLSTLFAADRLNGTFLFLQMRSRNEYLFSNWSEAAVLDLAEAEFILEEQQQHPTGRPSTDGLPVYAYVLIGVVVLILFGIIAVVCVIGCRRYCFHRWLKLDDKLIPGAPGGPRQSLFANLVRPSITDDWEISSNEIQIFESDPLGKGCFGEVYRGILAGRSMQKLRPAKFSLTCTVAVKQLKKNCTGGEKSAFLKEIDTMKKVSSPDSPLGKFVVNMVGCVTVKEPLLLILEYVKHGDLLSYFRSMRRQDPSGVYAELAPADRSVDERYAELGALEEKHLLEFARQIAAGMEYLSSMEIVHRDLACRNILIGEQRNLKISDFGMSRYVPPDEVYVTTQHGLLPLRWMPVESIFHRQFTTASDVWSYGIVLWEICTMGGFPYPMHSNKELAGLLKRGYRMEKPSNCSPEVYDIMLQCWSEDLEDRPKFAALNFKFDQFLSKHVQDHYPYIELQSVPPYRFDRLAPVAPPTATEVGKTPSISLRDANDCDGKDAPSTSLRVPSSSGNRLSMLSNSFQLLGSNQDLHGGGSSYHDVDRQSHISVESLDAAAELLNVRYVKSPIVASRSSNLIMSYHDMSIEEELIQHLERRLSDISSKHLAVLQDSAAVEQQKNDDDQEQNEVNAAQTTDQLHTVSASTHTSSPAYPTIALNGTTQVQNSGSSSSNFTDENGVFPSHKPFVKDVPVERRLRSFSESSKRKRKFLAKILPNSTESQV